jgi:ABC-type uncharacterized transport system ATPase subunit
MDKQPVLQMRGIWKRFGAVTALRDVDLELYPGEVLGLVGDNAAGKSTLMKVLSGAYAPSEGQILIGGQPVEFSNTRDAMDCGIEMVYQDFALCNNLNVTSNIFLGREMKKPVIGRFLTRLDKRTMEKRAAEILDELGIGVRSVKAKVERLSGGQRQAVAVGRSIGFKSKVVIMDEPTAALSVKSIAPLLELIKKLKESGRSIVLISHRLSDVFEVGDRVMVLKSGELVGVRNLHEVDIDLVVDLMVKGYSSAEEPDDKDTLSSKVYSAELSKWQRRRQATRQMKNWLQRFPDANAVVAANDEMALGASEAITAAGQTGMIVTGFDANDEALVAISEGRMHATVDQVPDLQARQAVQLMVRHLEKGEVFSSSLLWQDIGLITQDNVDGYIDRRAETNTMIETSGSAGLGGIKVTKPWRIGFVVKDTRNPYYIRMKAGAEKTGQELDVKVTVQAPETPYHVEEQIQIVEKLIQDKIDGLIIAPTDTDGLVPVVEKAVEQGIPVIAIATPLNTDKLTTFVGFDNATAGRMIGEWVVDQLGGSGRILVLEGPLGQENVEDRRNGFLEGFKKGDIEYWTSGDSHQEGQ